MSKCCVDIKLTSMSHFCAENSLHFPNLKFALILVNPVDKVVIFYQNEAISHELYACCCLANASIFF